MIWDIVMPVGKLWTVKCVLELQFISLGFDCILSYWSKMRKFLNKKQQRKALTLHFQKYDPRSIRLCSIIKHPFLYFLAWILISGRPLILILIETHCTYMRTTIETPCTYMGTTIKTPCTYMGTTIETPCTYIWKLLSRHPVHIGELLLRHPIHIGELLLRHPVHIWELLFRHPVHIWELLLRHPVHMGTTMIHPVHIWVLLLRHPVHIWELLLRHPVYIWELLLMGTTIETPCNKWELYSKIILKD